jgi:broad specificity phosphatase PhoE
MIRHAQAFENLNPTANSACTFELDGESIDNFDSAITPLGEEQAASLNKLFKSSSHELGDLTWFETVGLEGQLVVTSPLTRTLQTLQISFNDLPVGHVVASELVRASIGMCPYYNALSSFSHSMFVRD